VRWTLREPLRPRLRDGSRVAVLSPASAAKPELVEKGIDRLLHYGYRPFLMPNALARGPLYYAGTAEERLRDVHAAFADPEIEGLLCTRGGWGSAELLPHLDAKLVRENPKVFVGYSDHTSLHVWLWNELRMMTFYAPMVAADWSSLDGVHRPTWHSAVEAKSKWSVGPEDGLRSLRGGEVEGRLLGGCLSILAESLGTPWALRIDEPTILFLEDIGTKPYQWDRMLQHLRAADLLKHVRGIILGDMTANVKPDEMQLLEAACLHALEEFVGPVMIGLRSGHVVGQNRSLPLGAWVRINNDTVEEVS
jgi:muramoyltetrapeptide carboxypeptidase